MLARHHHSMALSISGCSTGEGVRRGCVRRRGRSRGRGRLGIDVPFEPWPVVIRDGRSSYSFSKKCLKPRLLEMLVGGQRLGETSLIHDDE